MLAAIRSPSSRPCPIPAAFGLRDRPGALVGALARSVAQAGSLAMGLAPFVLFFAVTTPRWEAALLVAGLWVAGALVCALPSNLVAAERGTAPEDPASASALLVAWGWTALLLLVLVRVSWLACRGWSPSRAAWRRMPDCGRLPWQRRSAWSGPSSPRAAGCCAPLS